MSRQTLLIPVSFPEPELYPLTDGVEGLDGFDIELVGYWEVPEGTTPEAARAAHETEAEAVLYDMAARLSHAGASTDIQLHFGRAGPDRRVRQDRIAEELNVDGVLFADRLRLWNNVLVPLRDDRNRDEIVDFVSAFDTDSIFVLELYHVAPDEEAVEPGETMLETVRETLLSRGLSDADLEITVEVADDPGTAIAERARNHNLVVLGETEELDRDDRLAGPVCEYILDVSETPTVIIRA